MRVFVVATLACAGCSLFLLDGLNEDAASSPAPSDAATNGETSAPDAPSPAADANDATDAPVDSSAIDPYGDAVKQDAPVGWWRLDDQAGATAAQDSSGKSVAAQLVGSGGISLGQPGATRPGSAFVFDGTAVLDLGDRFDFPSPEKYTFEAWVKPALSAADTDYHAVFTKIDFDPAPKSGRYIYYYLPTPRIGFEEWSATGNTLFAIHTIALPQDRFTHLVMTFDGVTPRIFVDGTLVKAGTKSDDLVGTATTFKWGDGWIGALDELAIYDKALDANRVKAHYEAAVPSN